MDSFTIEGRCRLQGEVHISGSKNACLPLMAAALLPEGASRVENAADLRDVNTMARLLGVLGARVTRDGRTITIDASVCESTTAPYELVKTMRASIYVLGPLLARFGEARVSLPGGCALGPRPVNLHIEAMRRLGAKVKVEHGYVVATAPRSGAGTRRLKGGRIRFDVSSVGATANAMMAASLADGKTTISNAAREPEILSLSTYLEAMGASVTGAGTSEVEVEGAGGLSPASTTVPPDRIEAGTYATAAAMTQGDVTLKETPVEHIAAVLDKLEESGASLSMVDGGVRVVAQSRPRSVDIITAPYPGFPTDMQAQFMAYLCLAEGTSTVVDTIFPDRFVHVAELQRMGAEIILKGNSAVVTGGARLTGAQVMASDLRASAALILAGLVAEGRTEVSRVYHIDRGYERIEEKLTLLGARIERVRKD